MQLACPACSATYRVPDAMIGAGRMMRCARCGHDWFAVPAGADAAGSAAPGPTAPIPAPPAAAPAVAAPSAVAPPAASPPPAPPLSAGAPAKPAGSRVPALAALGLAWLASLGLLGWGAYFVWSERAVMTALWPAIAKLYRVLGA